MIRLIEDIVPPDRPEESLPPRPQASFPPSKETVLSRKREERLDHELPHRVPMVTDREGEISDPPPFISRIPPRDLNENRFFERKREERPSLFEENGGSDGGFRKFSSSWLESLLSRRGLLLGVLLILVVLYVSLSIAFRKVTIVVDPKTEHVVLNAHLSAVKESKDKLPFTVLTLTATETKDVVASESKVVNSKASGKIVVYNEYSGVSQRLIKNTRFQAANGKIYRIAESITVPGVTTVSGKSVAGRVEVTVYADATGPDYNIPLTDFTIPGLKGDPRFQKMYARSKTPMTGGFSGEMRVVSDNDLAKGRQEIESKLKERLRLEAHESEPADYVLYDQGIYVVTRPLERTDVEGSENSVRLSMQATMYAVMFPRARLSQELAKDAVPNYDGAPVAIADLDLLQMVIAPKSGGDPWNQTDLALTVSGDTNIVWTVDTEALVGALAGKKKGEFPTILSTFQSIDEAKAQFRPFWWTGRFPGSPDRMTTEVTGS